MLRIFVIRSSVLKPILQSEFLFSTTVTLKKKVAQSLIQKLSAEFSDISPIIHELKNTELSNTHFDEWKSRIYMLKKYFFSENECFTMVSKYPRLLKIPLDKLSDSLKQWFNAGFRMNNIHLVLYKNPQLLEVDVTEIRKRLPQLKVLVRTTDALALLLLNSPNVMYDNRELISKKIIYLKELRRFSMGDIIHSFALSKSFSFIKFRFDLLEKCGIYKQVRTPVHKINKYDKSRHLNPHLSNILDFNLNNFIALAKISSEEYAVYKELFMDQEFHNNEDVDDMKINIFT